MEHPARNGEMWHVDLLKPIMRCSATIYCGDTMLFEVSTTRFCGNLRQHATVDTVPIIFCADNERESNLAPMKQPHEEAVGCFFKTYFGRPV